jgi:NAD(P)-dependent dehydrogenase (short-subunit alcohol dehydrogenase family)
MTIRRNSANNTTKETGDDMGQVQGKVAFVTGGASGIGAACARTLAREGASVVVTDLDDASGKALVDEITGAGGKAIYLHQDVTDEGGWSDAIGTAESTFGGLHILVANAGIAIMGPAIDMSLAEFRRQNAVNVDGVFLTVKYGIPAMRRSGGGSIIMMSSVAGLRGSAGLAGYSASKGAVRLFAKSMALECALAEDNIRVNSVHPGIIVTPIWTKMPAQSNGRQNAPLDPDAIARASVPLGKPADPQEIANGVLFLASDASGHMTGSELVIDGGLTAGRIARLG